MCPKRSTNGSGSMPARRNCSMSAAVLDAIERELAIWEWRERLASHPTTDLGIDAATLIAEERNLRDAELA